MKRINYPSKNFDDRPEDAKISFLILHSTECDLDLSLQILTDETSDYPVSAHYVVAQNGDIYELVDEKYRAWHAGQSSWGDSESLNATSIGIEIVNSQGSPYSPEQMKSVFELSRENITKYRIKPNHILAHSDIALGRKIDPGPLFDWKWLAEKGVGFHPDIQEPKPQTTGDLTDFFHLSEPVGSPYWGTGGIAPVSETPNLKALLKLQDTLRSIGYGVEPSGAYDDTTRHAIRAFQMKFRQGDVSGDVDTETLDLIRKYRGFLEG